MFIFSKNTMLNLMNVMCGAKYSPIGASDGSRGIHPTGLMRHTINRHVRDKMNLMRFLLR